MFWSRRNKKRTELAAWVTSGDDRDRAVIDRAIASDPALKDEAEALDRLVKAIPKSQPELDVDLLPLVKARLAAESAHGREPEGAPAFGGLSWLPAAAGLAAAVIVVAGIFALRPDGSTPVATVETVADTPGARALAEVRAHLTERQDIEAYDRALAAVTQFPADPHAGELAMIAADLAFDMQRYEEAFEAYTQVRAEYSDTLTAHPDWEKRVANRRDVLAEARKSDYESLYAYELAKRDRANPVAGFEDVIAKYPDTLVASLATESIGRVILEEEGLDPNNPEHRVLAMKTARERCTHPVAVASLELEIGLAYINDFQDSSLAEAHITAASENPMLAQRVQNAMTRLRSTSR